MSDETILTEISRCTRDEIWNLGVRAMEEVNEKALHKYAEEHGLAVGDMFSHFWHSESVLRSTARAHRIDETWRIGA